MSTSRAASLRHVRPVQPLRFPEQEPDEERMGQGRRHYNLCHALYQMLCAVCVPAHTVGADQFVYFDAANPRRCLVPDAFVTLGVPDHDFDSYLGWEEGTPDVAFEVLSPSDTPERWTFEEKLRRYHALGVRELVTFHVDAPEGERLRIWDRLEQDFVERTVTGDTSPCVTLGLTLLIGPVDKYPTCLRLARDAEGRDLVRTTDEQRLAAEARVIELEAKLAAPPPQAQVIGTCGFPQRRTEAHAGTLPGEPCASVTDRRSSRRPISTSSSRASSPRGWIALASTRLAPSRTIRRAPRWLSSPPWATPTSARTSIS